VDQKAKTLLVEHAIRPSFRLVKMKPAETTAAAYRFEIRLAPGAVEKFPVVEEQLIERTVALVNATPGLLLTFIQNKTLDEAARRQLDRIAQQKSRIAANDGEVRRAQEQIDELVRDQERLRQNISSLNRVAGQQEQVQSYAKKLADEEVQLAALRDRLAELRKTKAAFEAELNELIEKAQF
jgi:DNA repair exonuclease SbcCD ATPase subunit